MPTHNWDRNKDLQDQAFVKLWYLCVGMRRQADKVDWHLGETYMVGPAENQN